MKATYVMDGSTAPVSVPPGSRVARHVGAAARADLITPFRQVTLERIDRPDGSLLLRWVEDTCSLQPGIASPRVTSLSDS